MLEQMLMLYLLPVNLYTELRQISDILHKIYLYLRLGSELKAEAKIQHRDQKILGKNRGFSRT